MSGRGRRSAARRPQRRARRRPRGKKTPRGPLAAVRVAVGVAAVASLAVLGVHLARGEAEPPEADAAVVADLVVWSGDRVRVEVFNGGGVSGMARRATSTLRDSGFDVVTFGNAASFDPERPSSVIDRVGRADMAQAVAEALGIDNVQSEPDPNLFVDVTVVLGSEWSAPAGSASRTDAAGRSWWDPRGWIETLTTSAPADGAER